MFKMLVVEDERWEREGLMDFLDWNSLGIELSGVACDGIEGLEKARELCPDIIITDIKMPGMDGLKMSRNIRDFLPNVKIIILTGYDDFKLARDAINLNANAYILKPVEEHELRSALAKVLVECSKEAKKIEEEKLLKELLDENRNATRRELLNCILREKLPAEVLQQVSGLAVLPECSHYAVIAVGLNSKETTDLKRLEELFAAIAGGGINSIGAGISTTLHTSDEILFVIAGWGNSAAVDLEQTARLIVEDIQKEGVQAAAGIGGIATGLDELHVSCRQAKDALDFGLFWGDCKAVPYTLPESLQKDQAVKVGEFLTKGNYLTKQLMHSLRAADEERMNTLLAELFQLVDDSKWADRNRITNFLYGLLNETSLLFYNTNLSELDEGTAGDLLLSLPDIQSIKGYTLSFFEKAMGIIKDKKSNKDEYVVKKVQQIVTERYKSDIGIKTIAAEIYLSPNYLGSIFKKCAGISFNDYLCQYRMEKAKELLQSPKYKVSRVAQEVGIPNASYFCQLFKEMYGIAPGEYQEMVIRGSI